MADKRELESIRPAKGAVKTQKKGKIERNLKKPGSHKIISNINQNIPPERIEPPTEEAVKIVAKVNKAKDELIGAMRAFNNMLNSKKLLENTSEREKQSEQMIINELIRTSQVVENLQPTEGVMSMCIFAVRLAISLRNAGNSLAHKVMLLGNRVRTIENKLGIEVSEEDPKAKEKQKILEMAKELGIKVSIDGD
jgi:hypothetical protein